MSRGTFEGRAAIVTGAASGIGAATARRLASEGAWLVLVDVDEEGLARTRNQLGDGASRCQLEIRDVTDERGAAEAVSQCRSAFGRVDSLVNAAGIALVGTVPDTSLADWRRVFAVNVESVYLYCRAAIPLMCEAGGGTIVNVASEAGLVGFESYAAYSASKSAVVGLTRSIALDHAGDGIRVNCVCPGSIDTPLLRRWYDDQADPQRARDEDELTHPLGIGQPEDVAEAIVFLAGERSRYTTGVAFPVDGGYTCR
jgi:NAD(P)-dependent dehydrogenase (short-subunit alcohol dehydrogenase family)